MQERRSSGAVVGGLTRLPGYVFQLLCAMTFLILEASKAQPHTKMDRSGERAADFASHDAGRGEKNALFCPVCRQN